MNFRELSVLLINSHHFITWRHFLYAPPETHQTPKRTTLIKSIIDDNGFLLKHIATSSLINSRLQYHYTRHHPGLIMLLIKYILSKWTPHLHIYFPPLSHKSGRRENKNKRNYLCKARLINRGGPIIEP